MLESEEVALTDGLSLVRAETLNDVPDDLRLDEMGTVAMLALDSAAGDDRALEDAGRRLRRLQTALRLWDDAEPSLGPTAWARTGGSAWSAVPLSTGIRRDAGDCLLAADEEDPLRAFCSLVTRRTPRGGELAWALRRFELGCERATAIEALTDWLLAARALLADQASQGYDGMAERLAVICATPDERPALEARSTRRSGSSVPRSPGACGPTRWSRTWSPTSEATCARSCATSCAATWTRSCAVSPTRCSARSRSPSLNPPIPAAPRRRGRSPEPIGRDPSDPATRMRGRSALTRPTTPRHPRVIGGSRQNG